MATCMKVSWCLLRRIPIKPHYRLYKQFLRKENKCLLAKEWDQSVFRCFHSAGVPQVDFKTTKVKSTRKPSSPLEKHFNKLREQFYRNKMFVTSESLSELMLLLKYEQSDISPYTAFRLLEFIGTPRFYMLQEDQLDVIKKMWKMLREKGLKPEANHYHSLMKALIMYDKHFSADEVLLEMQTDGVPVLAPIYMLIIDSYCAKGDLEGASLVLKMMQRKGVQVDSTLPELLIKGYFRANKVEKAMEIFNDLRNKNGGSVSKSMYLLLIRLYAEKGNTEAMLEVKKEAEDRGVLFDSLSFVDVVDTLRQSDHLQLMDEVIEMTKSWLTVPRHDFVIQYAKLEMAGHHDAALKLLSVLDGTTVKAQDFVVELLLKIPITQKWPIEDTLSLVKRFCPTETVADLVVAVYAAYKYGEVDYAMEVLEHIKNQGYPLKAQYFYPAILQYSDSGNTDGVLKAVEKMAELLHHREISIAKIIVGITLDKDKKHSSLEGILAEHGISVKLPIRENGMSSKKPGYREFMNYINNCRYDEALEFFEGAYLDTYFFPKSLTVLCEHYIENKSWSKLQRLLECAFEIKLLSNLCLKENEFFEEAPHSVKEVLVKKMELVLKTYSEEELEMSVAHAGGDEMKRIIKEFLFMKKHTLPEAAEVLSDEELRNCSFKCINHRISLYLKENQMERAATFLHDVMSGSERVEDKEVIQGMQVLLTSGVNNSLNEINKIVENIELIDLVTRNPIFVGHWIQSLCHTGSPEEVYPVVETLALKYKFSDAPLVCCCNYIQGYIARDITQLALDAYHLTTLHCKTEAGSHFLMEYLTRKGEFESLQSAYDTCWRVFSGTAAASSFFYATVMNSVPEEVTNMVNWDPKHVSVKPLSCILSTLYKDLQATEALDKMERIIERCQHENIVDCSQLTKILFFFSTKACDFPRALRLRQTLHKVRGHGNMESALIRQLVNRDCDIGLNVPRVYTNEMYELMLEQKRRNRRL